MNTIITINNQSFAVDWSPDPDMGPPWKEEDGHGPVSEWTRRSKRPGEMVLCSDRGCRRYYNFQSAVKIARLEGWGVGGGIGPGRTAGERAHNAALADFEYLRRWCNDEWQYQTVSVTPLDSDGERVESETQYLGGCAGDEDYLMSVAQELAEEWLYSQNRDLSYRVIEPWEELGEAPDMERHLLAA